jgi:hypothetical protein
MPRANNVSGIYAHYEHQVAKATFGSASTVTLIPADAAAAHVVDRIVISGSGAGGVQLAVAGVPKGHKVYHVANDTVLVPCAMRFEDGVAVQAIATAALELSVDFHDIRVET